MIRAPRDPRVFLVPCLVALVVAGCGGGDAAVADGTVPPATAPGGTTTPGSTVAGTDPNATSAPGTDPLATPTGTTAVPGTSGATASIPDLSGGDVGRGYGELSLSAFEPEFPIAGGSDADPACDCPPKADPLPVDPMPTAATSYSGAVIAVDGVTYTVSANGTFPKGNPIFRLLGVAADSVEVQLVAGELTTGGGDGFFLDKGDAVSLVNASEQVTYDVRYIRPIESDAGIGL